MGATAGDGLGADDAGKAWWPFATGAAFALAAVAAVASWFTPWPSALRAAGIPEQSVAWLMPALDGAPLHWLDGAPAGDLQHLPRDGRATQIAILLADQPDGAHDALLFLPAAVGAPSVFVNGAFVPAVARAGAPYLASPRMRPVAIAIPGNFFRPGANRLDAVFPGTEDPALIAPPMLADEADLASIAARLSSWTGPLRGIATWLSLTAACLALAASAFAGARAWFLGLAAAAAACGCRMLPVDADLTPWLAAHPALADKLFLSAALASLACAAVNRPRLRPGRAGGIVTGALGALIAAASLVAVYEAFEPFSGPWLPWLEAFYACGLIGTAFALAIASAWTFGWGAVRFASANLNLSRAVRRQRIEIEQANRALELQMRRAAILEERQRLARDVHDGVGGTLASLLARIRMRRIDIGHIESELVDGLADLRLIVDSMDAAGGSLATALAVFRARIAPQVEAAGMTLVWEQQEHPGGGADDPPWMLHLYRLMQEAVNNALRHSGGRNLRVSIRQKDGRTLRIEIADDGVGLPARGGPHGNGLSNMAWRAQQVGAALRFEPAAGHAGATSGTRVVVEVALPPPDAIHPRDGIRPS